MGKNNKYVLAMYDVRGKQNFIYKSQKIKEIIWGSKIIEDVFTDYLYPAARKYCENHQIQFNSKEGAIYDYKKHQENGEPLEEFCVEKFKERMKSGKFIGEAVYEGGGNFFVLYRDAETCVEVNKIFTAKLLREIGTLKVLCTFMPVENFSDYEGERDKLYELHHVHEAQESVIYPVNTLPFVQTAPDSNRPYTGKAVTAIEKGKQGEKDKVRIDKVTTEQQAKYKKYKKYTDKYNKHKDHAEGNEADMYDQEEYLLDKLVEKRGEESLLAVIYIDGNGMGDRVQKCLDDVEGCNGSSKKSYDGCVTALRKFSTDIQQEYVDQRIQKINKALEKKYEGKKEKVRRTIVKAGDEMTIICNARDALTVVRAYFEELPEGDSSCVGIAIFHSHAPYADAYRIAEECCESCKTYMKHAEISDQSFMDFHYCQGGIGISLESIRERESGGRLYSRPWRIDKGEKDEIDETIHFTPVFNNAKLGSDQNGPTEAGYNYGGVVDSFAKELNKTARGNMKTLRNAAQHSKQELEMELKRIKAHSAEGKKMDFSQKVDGEKTDSSKEVKEKKIEPLIERERDLIYDITMIYDLWFAKEEEDDNKTSDVKD